MNNDIFAPEAYGSHSGGPANQQVTYQIYEEEGSFDVVDEEPFDNDEELCEEEKKFECPKNFFEAVKRLKGLLVAVEFECAGCCKKAIGILRCIEPDYIELFRPEDGLVQVQMFCPGMTDCATTECACVAVIRFEKIISVEQVANQICPHKHKNKCSHHHPGRR